MTIKQNMHLNLNGKGKKVNKHTLINIRRKTMSSFINELLNNQTNTWTRYAETIAMEDINEECEVFLPEESKQSNYKEGI